jgi:hypothetical protein
VAAVTLYSPASASLTSSRVNEVKLVTPRDLWMATLPETSLRVFVPCFQAIHCTGSPVVSAVKVTVPAVQTGWIGACTLMTSGSCTLNPAPWGEDLPHTPMAVTSYRPDWSFFRLVMVRVLVAPSFRIVTLPPELRIPPLPCDVPCSAGRQVHWKL